MSRQGALLTSLEPVFTLDYIVHDLVVLTCVSAIDQVLREFVNEGHMEIMALTIAAHHTRHTCHNTPQERVRVNFVLRAIIYLRRRLRSFVLLLAVDTPVVSKKEKH